MYCLLKYQQLKFITIWYLHVLIAVKNYSFFKITVDLTTAAFSTTKTTQLNQKKTCKDYTDCRCVWVDLQRLIGLKQLNKSYNILPQPHWCCECLFKLDFLRPQLPRINYFENNSQNLSIHLRDCHARKYFGNNRQTIDFFPT